MSFSFFAADGHAAFPVCFTMPVQTALLDAARRGNTEQVRTLLRRRVDPADVNYASHDGSTATIVAAENGHTATVAALAEAGAAVNAADTTGWTPLHFAAVNGHAACARLLVQAGAMVDARERIGWTPLHMAAMNGRTECACALVEVGAALDAVNKFLLGAVHVAARSGHADCTRTLVAMATLPAVLDAAAAAGLTVHRATAAFTLAQRSAVAATSANGVEARTYYGETALHLAAVSGHVEAVRALVAVGADVQARDQDGQTARDKARKRNKHAVVTYLATCE